MSQIDPFGAPVPTNLSQNVNNSKLIKESCNPDGSTQQQQQQQTHDSSQENIDGGNHSHHIHQTVSIISKLFSFRKFEYEYMNYVIKIN